MEFRRSDLFEFETVTLDRLEQVENFDALFRLLREAVGQGSSPGWSGSGLAGPSPLNRELRASDRGELCELFRRGTGPFRFPRVSGIADGGYLRRLRRRVGWRPRTGLRPILPLPRRF